MEDELGQAIRDELAMAKPPPDVVAMPRTNASQPIPVGHQHVTGYELDDDGVTAVEGTCVVGSVLTRETIAARIATREKEDRNDRT